MTVARLEEELTVAEFAEWSAYFRRLRARQER